MKKIIFAGAILLFAFGAKAQTTIYSGDGNLSSNRVVNLNSKTLHFKPALLGNGLFINASGWVGIGNTNPTQELDVNGDIKALTGTFTNAPLSGSYLTNTDRVNATLAFTAGYPVSPTTNVRSLYLLDMPVSNMDQKPAIWFGVTDRGNFSRLRFRCETGGNSQFTLFDKAQNENFTISDDGNGKVSLVMPGDGSYVGIGTTNFTDGTDIFRLSVDGNIRARRVKVYTSWADYVFEDDYCLPTLEEVEQHIEEKGHLIDIPSAAEVEANGIELGEMNKLLLQKIEELTLYTIELNKQVQELKNKLNDE